MKQVSPLIVGVLVAVIIWMTDSLMLGYTMTDPTILGMMFTDVPIIRLSYRLMFLLICVLVGGFKTYNRIVNFDSIFDKEEPKKVKDSIRGKYSKKAKVETVKIGHKTIERAATPSDSRVTQVYKGKEPKKASFLTRNAVNEKNRQIAEYCNLLGVKVGLSMRDLSKLNDLCFCHGIGYFGDNKADHIIRGVKIAEEIPAYRRLAFGIKYHHERYDGRGPYRLKGKRIPVICRILAIGEKFYDLTNPEGEYKLNRKKGLSALLDYSGSELDPELVFVFISTMDKGESLATDLLTEKMGDYMTDDMKKKIAAERQSVLPQ